MENLSIGTSAVELTIDNDPERVIRFYPTDVAFAESFFSLVSEYEKKQKDIEKKLEEVKNGTGTNNEKALAGIKLEREAFDVLREGIDRTFGDGTSQTVFGDRNTLDMAARFFVGVTPYIRRARQNEVERYTKAQEDGVLDC